MGNSHKFPLNKATSHYMSQYWPSFVWPYDINRAHWVNSLSLRDTYICHQTRPSLVQIMVCRLFGTKPLSEPILDYCQLDPCEHISVKIKKKKYNNFHWRKWIWNCHLQTNWRSSCLGLNVLRAHCPLPLTVSMMTLTVSMMTLTVFMMTLTVSMMTLTASMITLTVFISPWQSPWQPEQSPWQHGQSPWWPWQSPWWTWQGPWSP